MSSLFIKELEEFAIRLKNDGYPTALVERAAKRMADMEEIIMDNYQKIAQLEKDYEQIVSGEVK